MGPKSKAQKNYWNRKDALLEGCVEEIQERIPVGFIQGWEMIIAVDTILPLWPFFQSYILMLLCPQRKYRSKEADKTCNPGLDPVADRGRLSHSTILGSLYYTPTYSTICITPRLSASLSLSIFKPSHAIFKINSYFYDMLLPSLMQVEFWYFCSAMTKFRWHPVKRAFYRRNPHFLTYI